MDHFTLTPGSDQEAVLVKAIEEHVNVLVRLYKFNDKHFPTEIAFRSDHEQWYIATRPMIIQLPPLVFLGLEVPVYRWSNIAAAIGKLSDPQRIAELRLIQQQLSDWLEERSKTTHRLLRLDPDKPFQKVIRQRDIGHPCVLSTSDALHYQGEPSNTSTYVAFLRAYQQFVSILRHDL